MTATELKNELSTAFTDYEFLFNEKKSPFVLSTEKMAVFFASVKYGNSYKEFDNLDKLISTPFLDGKSLNEVADEVELYG